MFVKLNVCENMEILKHTLDEDDTIKFITNLIETENTLSLCLLPDNIIDEFKMLSDYSIKKFVALFEHSKNNGNIHIFIGKVLDVICDRIVTLCDVDGFDLNLNLILNNNCKYMKLETCLNYLHVYNINIANIAQYHEYPEIYNEYLTGSNISEQIGIILTKLSGDKTMKHTYDFFRVLDKKWYKMIVNHVISQDEYDRYIVQGILMSPHLTLDCVEHELCNYLIDFFDDYISKYVFTNLSPIFIDYMISKGKTKFSSYSLNELAKLTSEINNPDLLSKLLILIDISSVVDVDIKHITTIVEYLLCNANYEQLSKFSEYLLQYPFIFEIYANIAPPLMVIAKKKNFTLDELVVVISKTDLDEQKYVDVFDQIDFVTMIEKYLDEVELRACLSSVTTQLRKIIVSQIVRQHKQLSRETLIKFNNIYPIIVKKIYLNFVSQRIPRLLGNKLSYNAIQLSTDEILDLCLIKDKHECIICFTNGVDYVCRECGHGICAKCENDARFVKTKCAYCRKIYNYVVLR